MIRDFRKKEKKRTNSRERWLRQALTPRYRTKESSKTIKINKHKKQNKIKKSETNNVQKKLN
jgi:hypothetical protein